ncbi:MAG: hypothetical protein IKQ16_05305 [Lentisphaeria bacterium]|nr:hypothetical protein [Lentisphaeria bacterium]
MPNSDQDEMNRTELGQPDISEYIPGHDLKNKPDIEQSAHRSAEEEEAARDEPCRHEHARDQRRQHNHEDAEPFAEVDPDMDFFFRIRHVGGIALFGILVLIAHGKLAVLLCFDPTSFIIPHPLRKNKEKIFF